MKKSIALFIVILMLGGLGFFVLKRYLPNLVPPSKDIKQYLPLNADTPYAPILINTGYKMDVFADLKGEMPKNILIDDNDNLLVLLTNTGKVISLSDNNKDLKADTQATILSNLLRPVSISLSNGYLYVLDINKIVKYLYDPMSLTASSPEVVYRFPNNIKNIFANRQMKVYGQDIYFSDPATKVIYKVDGSGNLTKYVSTKTQDIFFNFDRNGKFWMFDQLGNLSFDKDGDIYVIGENRIFKKKIYGGEVIDESVFASGFKQENDSIGHPYDLVFDSNNNLLISDDSNGLIYILYK